MALLTLLQGEFNQEKLFKNEVRFGNFAYKSQLAAVRFSLRAAVTTFRSHTLAEASDVHSIRACCRLRGAPRREMDSRLGRGEKQNGFLFLYLYLSFLHCVLFSFLSLGLRWRTRSP